MSQSQDVYQIDDVHAPKFRKLIIGSRGPQSGPILLLFLTLLSLNI